MQLTIFGATGRTGQPLVQQALEAGHTVVAFARTPSKLDVTHDRLTIVQGDVMEPKPVHTAVEGADAVLSALGHTSDSPDDMQTVGTRHIIDAMQRHGVDRLVSLAGAAVRHPRDTPSWGDRLMIGLMRLFASTMLEDARRHAELIRATDLDWTIVRPPRLTNGPHTGTYRTGYLQMGPMASIARADVADFMLRCATSDDFIHEEPMLCY
jgi:putative NADH-flavin reductase